MQGKLLFYSTNGKAKEVGIKEAILKGLAEDKGLYMPKEIPQFTPEELASFSGMQYWEIATVVLKKFLAEVLNNDTIATICKESYTWTVPIEKLADGLHVMRLDQGPTAAFKDFAAQAMARILECFLVQDHEELLILTATSGDTGSAVARAFFGLEQICVVIVFPKKEVTEPQRKLMTTLGKNITAIAVDGTFDDCQMLVKNAFVDEELRHLKLSSANSINFARLMPQIVYYVYAFAQLGKVNYSVPSGNFGNLVAGLLAKNMGLPVGKFIVAVNENNEFVQFFTTGEYKKIRPSRNCLSNAMNVGHPSNFARVVALYDGKIDETGSMLKSPNMTRIRNDLWTVSVTDQQTRDEIKSVHNRFGTLVEPHGAVGLFAYEKYMTETADKTAGVCLETAHPAKFPDVIKEVLHIDPDIPESIREALEKKEVLEHLPNEYGAFKNFLRKRFS